MKRVQRSGIIPRNGKYCVKWYFEGRQHWKTFRTKKEAEQFRARTTSEIADGVYRPIKDIPFDKFASRWLEEKAQKVRPSTIASYSAEVRSFLAFFDSQKLRKIDYRKCKEYVAAKVAEGRLSAKTIGYHIRDLRAIFAEAVKEGYLKVNPALYLEKPKAEKKTFELLDPGECQRLLEAIDPRYRLLLLTAMLTGARQGEILALTWDCIDLKNCTLRIEKSLYQRKLVSVKTEAGKRTVSIPQFLVEEFRKAHKMALDEGSIGESNLVFTNSSGGPIDATGWYRREFLGALKKAGIEKKTRFHDIRHGFASRLLAATGNDLAYVCDQLGHSSPNVTLSIYAHALKTQRQEIAEKVSARILGVQEVKR